MAETDSPLPVAPLHGRKLLLGVTGGIAAYKAALLVRLFKKAGAEVQVLMTSDAARFVTPLTLGTLSEREVLTEIFPENASGSWTKHVHLGLWADLFVVAPATAQTIAKLAHGFCDSMLTAAALSARCPLLVCPAMDHDMYRHPATQRNLQRLRDDGHTILDAAHGELASGLVGQGRLPEPEVIFDRVVELLGEVERQGDGETGRRGEGERGPSPDEGIVGARRVVPAPENEHADEASKMSSTIGEPGPIQNPKSKIQNRTVLVTAGPTREHVDPVRFFSNPSTGTMGFALAAAAVRQGARVTLVTGPTTLETPPGVERVDVVSAEEMHAAVQQRADADLVIAAAAVADYTPAEPSERKIKKQTGNSGSSTGQALTLRLRRTPDILGTLGQQKRPGQTLVGFALETHDAVEHARDKLRRKNLDWIVLNDLSEPGAGFGTRTNRVHLIGREGHDEKLPLASKQQVAEAILERVVASLPDAPGE